MIRKFSKLAFFIGIFGASLIGCEKQEIQIDSDTFASTTITGKSSLIQLEDLDSVGASGYYGIMNNAYKYKQGLLRFGTGSSGWDGENPDPVNGFTDENYPVLSEWTNYPLWTSSSMVVRYEEKSGKVYELQGKATDQITWTKDGKNAIIAGVWTVYDGGQSQNINLTLKARIIDNYIEELARPLRNVPNSFDLEGYTFIKTNTEYSVDYNGDPETTLTFENGDVSVQVTFRHYEAGDSYTSQRFHRYSIQKNGEGSYSESQETDNTYTYQNILALGGDLYNAL